LVSQKYDFRKPKFTAHAVFKLREGALKSYLKKKGEIFCGFSKASECVSNEM
jgi:hypothetical protein